MAVDLIITGVGDLTIIANLEDAGNLKDLTIIATLEDAGHSADSSIPPFSPRC
jgi:hypothetical protein